MGIREAIPSLGSIGGGLCFGIGWILWIDAVTAAYSEYGVTVNGAYWVPGILQTLSLFMVNVINWSLLTEDSFDESVGARVKLWVFCSFVLAFSGLFGAMWILVAEFNRDSETPAGNDAAVRCLLQNLFVFAGSLLFRVVRTKEE